MRIEHILIIRLSSLGDIAMTVPVVYSLAKQYPSLRITVLSNPVAKVFFENLSDNIRFMEANLHGEKKNIHQLNLLYKRLAAKQFTAIADFHDVLRSKYLRYRFYYAYYKTAHINKHRKERFQLTAKNGKNFHQLPTTFENYADVLNQLGYPIRINFSSIFPPEGGDLSLIFSKIGDKKDDDKWIGIAPFAAYQTKTYPAQLMDKVICLILQRYATTKIFLFGDKKKEGKVLDEWEKKYERCVNASSKLENLKEELILMSHLKAMITMDSANMHLASLVNTPVISIWGSTHPYAGFLGWNQKIDNAIQVELDCRPCSIYGNKPCRRKDLACLCNIQPAAIVDKLGQIAYL